MTINCLLSHELNQNFFVIWADFREKLNCQLVYAFAGAAQWTRSTRTLQYIHLKSIFTFLVSQIISRTYYMKTIHRR